MSVTCPNCGKPVRQGAKFCGSCRAELPAIHGLTPVARPNPSAQASPPPVGMLCPQCGTVVRQGARFCPRCGSAVQAQPAPQQNQTVVPPATAQQGAQSARADSQTEKLPMQPASRATAAAATAVAAAAATAAPPQARKRRGQALIVFAALLVLCCAASAAATALTRRLWQPRVEAVLGGASVEKTATQTEEPPAPPTASPTATATPEPPTVTPTTPAPTETPPAPTATQPLRQKPSDTPVPPVMKTPAAGDSLEIKLISEDFSQGSLEKWKLSGENPPVIEPEGGNFALVFPGSDSAALFAKAFELKPGSTIEIVMQVEPEEEHGLHVRWIPGVTEPTDFENGARIKIDLENGNRRFVLVRSETNDEITKDIDFVDANMQAYKIVVKSDLSIAFLVNDEEVYAPPDKILFPGESSSGFIVFYGKGKLGLLQVSEKSISGTNR